jgi:hypothetical protein
VVFTSSIAVFGAPFPEKIGDEFFHTPLTSYGTQKAIGELLINDYSRRGFFDGIGIRLPTICVRPGQAEQGGVRLLLQHHPRAAGRRGGGAAGLGGRAALACLAASAVGFLIHAATMDLSAIGARRNLSMPGCRPPSASRSRRCERVAGENVKRGSSAYPIR